MKKIISFEKRLDFPSMIGEITSISLEHDLKFVDQNSIEGDFTVSGSYKLTEASRIEENFNYKIPTEIIITENLEPDTVHIDIDDFYYEIENDYTLICYIEVKVEGVEAIDIEEESPVIETPTIELPEKDEREAEIETLHELIDEPRIIETIESDEPRECDGESHEESIVQEMEEETTMETTTNTSVSSLFENINESEETYSTYSVYILREEETVNSLIEKYKTTKEELENYNDISNLSIGSKIIIPLHAEEN